MSESAFSKCSLVCYYNDFEYVFKIIQVKICNKQLEYILTVYIVSDSWGQRFVFFVHIDISLH